jgi:hypothetical protein
VDDPGEIQRRRRNHLNRATRRRITAEFTGLTDKTVTNALAEAQHRGLFARRSKFWRTIPTGELTPRGYEALGPESPEWTNAIGPTWTVITGARTRRALELLADEFNREAGLL